MSRLLLRYGIDKVIGDNLVRYTELNLRRQDGTLVGHAKMDRIEQTLGYPWWLVHRHHLHTGLVDVARQNDVDLVIDSRVKSADQTPDGKVLVTTEAGRRFTFDLVIGADGVSSITRQLLFPDVLPRPPSGNCAYRAIVPFEDVRADPETRMLVEDDRGNPIKTMEVWMAPTGYIITYPISNGRDFNMVLSHFHDPPINHVEEVDIDLVRQQYKDYDPRISRVVDKIKPPISRWPLLVTGPLETWSNDTRNIVLMGDAAHSMTNHMAQGAATSMEDGAYLARCLSAVMGGQMTLRNAIAVYEGGRIPKASYKQQISYLNGWLWHLPDGPAQEARDRAMAAELRGEVPMRSPNLYSDPSTVLECYGYDAEEHADREIAIWLNKGRPVRDAATTVTQEQADRIANWCLPTECTFSVRPE